MIEAAPPVWDATPVIAPTLAWEFLGFLTSLATASLFFRHQSGPAGDLQSPFKLPRTLQSQLLATSGEATSGSHASARPKYGHVQLLFRKKVTNATSLRSMHVTLGMVEGLQLSEIEAQPGMRSGAAAVPMQSLFKHVLVVRDSESNAWPVVYEATLSTRQCHRRLSKGWQDFCRYHGVQVGDTLEFQRCPRCETLTVKVRVVRRGKSV
jgi:hypothetical protein